MEFEMSTAPTRPPVHAYSGEDPMEVIDSKWGRMERWRAAALSTGEVGALASPCKQVRNDAVAAIDNIEAREKAIEAREAACTERELAHAVSVSNFVDFVGRAAFLFDRIEKQRADAVAGEQEDPLATPPGEPNELSKTPAPPLELEDDTHIPSGDLHTIAASEPQHEEQLPEPPETTDDMGGVPLSYKKVPTSYVHSSGDLPDPGSPHGEFPRLTRPIALDQTEFPDPELPHPPVVQQPIAAGLDDKD
jgi:hypothetical protein